jgi:serine protease Do
MVSSRVLRALFGAAMVVSVLGLVPASASARGAPESFADLAKMLLPAVVNISTTSVVSGRGGGQQELPQFPPGSPFEDFFRDFFDRNRPQQQQQRRATSLGSGFIIDPKGVVVTNNHVIQDAEEITVILQDDTRLTATVVGRDPKTDLAVLKVETKQVLPFVKFGNSDEARVGDWVVAIGNPYGLGGTVTAGIVSARGRNINSGPYDDFIQTDAAINRGNSGGPLFNMTGEVVGINTAIFSPTGASIGIGFAVPTSTAKAVIDQIQKYGRARRGWLGVRIQRVTDEIAENLKLGKTTGALVASITDGSPADKGKLKSGDVILKFDNKEVSNMNALPRIVAETEIGREVDVEYWREGKRDKTKVAVGELQEDQVASAAESSADTPGPKGEELAIKGMGFSVAALDSSARQRFRLKEQTKGVVISNVEQDGPAAEKGLRPGDVIVEISQEEVSSPGDVRKKVDEARERGRKSILLLVEGQGGLRFVALQVS